MKEKIIFSSILMLLLSGCSSKISSLNLKNNQNNKNVFLKKMDLNSVEVIFEIKDNKVNILDVGSKFSKNYLNLYKKENEDTSCLLISTKVSRPCTISKGDDIFYKKNFSFSDSLVTTTITLPLSLIEDVLGLVLQRKPTSSINAMKDGYTKKIPDRKNVELLSNSIQNTLLKEKLFKKLSDSELFSYLNNHTIYYQSGEKEYHSSNNETYYKRKNKDITKGIWSIKNTQVCYKYDGDSKQHCHNKYLYEKKYMDSLLEKIVNEISDVEGLEVKYKKNILKKERLKQERLVKKEQLKEKEAKKKLQNLAKIESLKNSINQTIVWYVTHTIKNPNNGWMENMLDSAFGLDTTYKYKCTGIVKSVNSNSCVVNISSIKLSVPNLVSINYIKFKSKGIHWGNSQLGKSKHIRFNQISQVID